MPKSSANITIPEPYFDAIFGEESKLKAYYPESFRMDLNFKQLNWESIAIMKHVDVELLEEVLRSKDNALTDEYKKRNMFGQHKLFVPSKKKQFKQDMRAQWGCTLEKDEQDDDMKVCQFEIKIPSSMDIAKECRACDSVDDVYGNEIKLKGINEKDLKIVSQTMCKYFMAGKQTPRGIVRYMTKRPSLWIRSVKDLRKGMKRSIRNEKDKIRKRMVLQKQKEKKKMIQKKEERKNDNFMSKLKSIG
eukprot:355049_1